MEQFTAYVIWNHKGPNSGQFTPAASQAEVDAAVAAGWGQDARAMTGLQLLPHEPPGPLGAPPPPPPTPRPAPPDDDDCDDGGSSPAPKGKRGGGAKGMEAGEEYATRHVEKAPAKRGRGRPRKAA